MSTLSTILEAARSLSLEERTQLVQSLVAMDCPEEEAWDPEWIAEIERRSQEYHDGKATLQTWEQVKSAAWQRLEGNASH